MLVLVYPAALEVFPRGDCLWQDDEAKIHRTEEVLNKVDGLFKKRIPPKMASVTADLYPIENLRSILKSEVYKKKPIKDLPHLNRILKQKRKEIDDDEPLLKKMMASIPARVEAMLELDGSQVHISDYSGQMGDS